MPSQALRRMLEEVKTNAARQGWRVKRSGRDHWKFFAPNGRDLIVTAGSTNSRRGFLNFLSHMRRAGYTEEK